MNILQFIRIYVACHYYFLTPFCSLNHWKAFVCVCVCVCVCVWRSGINIVFLTYPHTHIYTQKECNCNEKWGSIKGGGWGGGHGRGGGGGGGQVRRQNSKSLVQVLFVAQVSFSVLKAQEDWTWQVSEGSEFHHFGALQTKRNSGGQTFCSKMGHTKYLCICSRTKLPGRGVHSEKIRETGRRWTEVAVTDSWQFVVCSGLDR